MTTIDSIDLSQVDHHPMLEAMVDVLCANTQNQDRKFFRVEVAYFLAKMASSMRATILTKDRGEIPVNAYALALATSGFGKGHSINIIEEGFLKGFKNRFLEETFPIISDGHLWKLAIKKAAISGKEEEDEKAVLDKEFLQAGSPLFSFDSGTSPAVKQLRQKLLLANVGSINLQIDEIGSNLIGNTEVLNVFLELYDQGLVKQKLVKNTNDNQRGTEIDGKTPANMLLFGTPTKLLDGGQTEDHFYSFLETGYARRCLFAFGEGESRRSHKKMSPADIYKALTDKSNSAMIQKLSGHFTQLADAVKYQWTMMVDDFVGIALLTYKIECEERAEKFPEHDEIRKAEMSHRYFKVLKLAGAFAFIDESSEIEMDHLKSAVKLVEESGDSFQKVMTREKSYVKLAKFIASSSQELTHADLYEALPFYKSSAAQRTEQMTLATAWGYKQHIVVKKRFQDGIEFFSGETLEETNLDQIGISYSDHFAYNYGWERVPFNKLHKLTQAPGMHWCNHGFQNGHRCEENTLPGFNMVVLDVDGGTTADFVVQILQDYQFLLYTTKRHTQEDHRFRVMIPINYNLELDENDYKEFMNSLMDWMPFDCDHGANQRSKKWQSHKGFHYYNQNPDAVILDALPFVPLTSKNEQHKQQVGALESFDNLERWFASRMEMGARNNNMIKFALALVDQGWSYHEIENAVIGFNSKLQNPLSETELRSTVLQTVAKKTTA